MIHKITRYRDKEFLTWAKQQQAPCCLCGDPCEELHHWGEKGMGQKCHDYEVARLCRLCHAQQQGKRRLAYYRSEKLDVLECLMRDSIDLLMGYIAQRKGTVR